MLQVRFKSFAPLATWQALTPVSELVPNGRSDRALMAVFLEFVHDLGVGLRRDRGRDDARIDEVSQVHSETLRPCPRSRAESKYPSSRPTSRSGCACRNRP